MLPSHPVVHVYEAKRPGCLDQSVIERLAEDVVRDTQNEVSAEAAHVRGCVECLGDLLLEVVAKGVEYAEIDIG